MSNSNQLELFSQKSSQLILFPLTRRADAVRETALALSAREGGSRRWFLNHVESGLRVELLQLGFSRTDTESEILKFRVSVGQEIQRQAVKAYLYGGGND